MSHLSANLMGTLDLHLADLPLTNLRYDKVRALLVYLIVESDHPHRRESLAGLLWPDTTERAARQSLSQALLVLRRAIGDREANSPFLHITMQTLQFNTNSDHTLDVSEFTSLIDAVQQHAHRDLSTCNTCLLDLEQSAALYRGDFMTGFSLPNCPEFEIWLTLTRERLQQRAMDVCDHLAEAYLLSGNYESALKYAQRQLTLDNLREPAYRQAMIALAVSGQRSAALTQYETCERVMLAELGILPEPETSALSRRISNGTYDREQQMDTPVDEAQAAISNNLPYEVSPFIGRADLLAHINQHLLDPDTRLLTLLGPGGSGKTRLAQETAKRIIGSQDHDLYGDGIYFVSLAAIDTIQGIVPAIAQAIKLTFASTGEPDKQLNAYLSRKRMLLILDNFEHLTKGAGKLVDLLRSAPHLKILVTTRIKLAISAEQVIDVPGMVYPEDAGAAITIEDYSALLLFWQFARRVQPDFTVDEHNLRDVIKLCQLVKGMPLGLLLASAWMNMLNPREIAGEIEHSLDFLSIEWREIPARQRSMRAVFEHTWDLLSAREQRMLACLSVFKGGWTREAALAVAEVTLRDLLTLINKCLVQRMPDGRYEMHELLGQFAMEKLAGDRELTQLAQQAHANYFNNRLSEWWDDLRSPEHTKALVEIDDDLENACTAFEWLLDKQQFERLEDNLDCLSYYFRVRGLLDGGAAYFLSIVERLRTSELADARLWEALTVSHYGLMQNSTGRLSSAIDASERSLKYFDLTYDKALQLSHRELPISAHECRILANILYVTAFTYSRTNHEPTRHLYALCHRLYIETGNTWGKARSLNQLAITYMQSYRRKTARALFDQAQAIYQQIEDPVSLMRSLMTSGYLFASFGEYNIAGADLQRAEYIADACNLRLDYQFRELKAVAYNMQGKFRECLQIRLQLRREYSELGLLSRTEEITIGVAQCYNQLGEYERAIQLLKETYAYYISVNGERYAMGCLGQHYSALTGAGLPDQAMDYYGRWSEYYEQVGSGPLSRVDFLPFILYQLGRYDEMIDPVISWIRRTLYTYDLIDLLCVLPIASLIFLTVKQEERAIEVYALSCSHPYVDNAVWFEDVAWKFVKQGIASLPPDVVATAEERGRELGFWETAEALVDELEALFPEGS